MYLSMHEYSTCVCVFASLTDLKGEKDGSGVDFTDTGTCARAAGMILARYQCT